MPRRQLGAPRAVLRLRRETTVSDYGESFLERRHAFLVSPSGDGIVTLPTWRVREWWRRRRGWVRVEWSLIEMQQKRNAILTNLMLRR